MDYPTPSEEKCCSACRDHPIDELGPVTTPNQVQELQQAVTKVFVEDSVCEYVVRLVQATRSHPQVQLGASPRGSLALFRAAQAWAALEARDYVLPDDVKQLAVPILAHRLQLKADTVLRGVQAAAVVSELLHQVDVGVEGRESHDEPLA